MVKRADDTHQVRIVPVADAAVPMHAPVNVTGGEERAEADARPLRKLRGAVRLKDVFEVRLAFPPPLTRWLVDWFAVFSYRLLEPIIVAYIISRFIEGFRRIKVYCTVSTAVLSSSRLSDVEVHSYRFYFFSVTDIK